MEIGLCGRFWARDRFHLRWAAKHTNLLRQVPVIVHWDTGTEKESRHVLCLNDTADSEASRHLASRIASHACFGVPYYNIYQDWCRIMVSSNGYPMDMVATQVRTVHSLYGEQGLCYMQHCVAVSVSADLRVEGLPGVVVGIQQHMAGNHDTELLTLVDPVRDAVAVCYNTEDRKAIATRKVEQDVWRLIGWLQFRALEDEEDECRLHIGGEEGDWWEGGDGWVWWEEGEEWDSCEEGCWDEGEEVGSCEEGCWGEGEEGRLGSH